jgi:hypothetical protein
MRAGNITREGFLGEDKRNLAEILEADQATVSHLGLTHEEIADRMEYFTEKGKAGLGTWVEVDEVYEVRVEDVRGKLPSPWGGPGLIPKRNTYLRNHSLDEEIVWTAMNERLIRRHGFYEGKGSPFRQDPRRLKRVLGL